MVIAQAKNLSISEVERSFNLQEVQDVNFFREWQGLTSELAPTEIEFLDDLRNDFRGLQKHTSHEEIVKMFSLAPILRLSGLAKYPFIPRAEHILEIDLSELDEDDEVELIRGKVDIIISHENLWEVIIETKRIQASVMQALPQALTYMMGSPDNAKPIFGLCTNGTDFIFVKLVRGATNQYALSNLFSMYCQTNDLYQVVTILKHLQELVLTT